MQFIFYLSAILLISASSISAAYELTICAIFQDEAPFFKEWIEFHKLQGVQHFYLYNNNSEDNYLETLGPYISTNEVTLIEWPFTYEYGDHKHWIQIQTDAYMHCINTYGSCSEWIAVIDIDEFLFCPNGGTLPNFLKNYKRFGGVCVNWIKFGTSDIKDIPPDCCSIELLTRSSSQTTVDNLFVKSIVQPQHVEKAVSAHHFSYKKTKFAVDANKHYCNSCRTKRNCIDKIRINHYWTRTIKYLFENKIDSRQKRRPKYDTELILKMAESYNQKIDITILRYVKDLRRAMGFSEIRNPP